MGYMGYICYEPVRNSLELERREMLHIQNSTKPLAAQTDFFPDAKATISIVYNPAK
jgi:hypothetical protein